ncbi:MAG: hypothetical protein JO033_11545 [Acidobacteriaceae bacterium]|nr:hypothetical protein [Acidobacteriaceae bacterium]MBV9497825.1 hypothetical protein [Acidobacteriaceae bacterium]
MNLSVTPMKLIEWTLIFSFASCAPAQSFIAELSTEHDPGRRSQRALVLADSAFDDARDYYNKGDFDKGDASLEAMTGALNVCVESLQAARKAKFYKKAEMNVALLQRRMSSLLEDIDLQERGWAEQTNRTLDQIHDKLLAGVMGK